MRKVLLVGLLLITAMLYGQHIVRHALPVNEYRVDLSEQCSLGSNMEKTVYKFCAYLEKWYEFIEEVNLPREYKVKCYDILWEKYSYLDIHRRLNSHGSNTYIYPGIYFFTFFHKQNGSIESYGIFIIINNKNEVEAEMCWLIYPLGG